MTSPIPQNNPDQIQSQQEPRNTQYHHHQQQQQQQELTNHHIDQPQQMNQSDHHPPPQQQLIQEPRDTQYQQQEIQPTHQQMIQSNDHHNHPPPPQQLIQESRNPQSMPPPQQQQQQFIQPQSMPPPPQQQQQQQFIQPQSHHHHQQIQQQPPPQQLIQEPRNPTTIAASYEGYASSRINYELHSSFEFEAQVYGKLLGLIHVAYFCVFTVRSSGGTAYRKYIVHLDVRSRPSIFNSLRRYLLSAPIPLFSPVRDFEKHYATKEDFEIVHTQADGQTIDSIKNHILKNIMLGRKSIGAMLKDALFSANTEFYVYLYRNFEQYRRLERSVDVLTMPDDIDPDRGNLVFFLLFY
ncbi:MAG: hypothetical protein EOO46_13560 [Flavobacterium sp.]|nr:MAG: hypothetical protein EOO46_13560 [Flavobacterium sp.]